PAFEHVAPRMTDVAEVAEARGEQVLRGGAPDGEVIIGDVGRAGVGGDADVHDRSRELAKLGGHRGRMDGGDEPVRIPTAKARDVERARAHRAKDPRMARPRISGDAAYGVSEKSRGHVDDEDDARENGRQARASAAGRRAGALAQEMARVVNTSA